MKRQELISALAKVKPALATKETIEQSTFFAFKDGRVVTYNDEICISYPLPGMEVEGAVKAEELYQFLGKSKAEEIDLAISDKGLEIKAGKAKAIITFNSEIILPIDQFSEINNWKKLPESFCETIKFVSSSCSKDMSKPALICVHIKKGKMEACDNFRLTQYELKGLPSAEMLIPSFCISPLIQFKPVSISFTENSGWIYFQNEEEAVFSCRTFPDKFPDLSEVIDSEGEKIELPKDLSEILDKAQIFCKGQFAADESVNIALQKNKLEVFSKGDFGEFSEWTRLKYSGKNFTFNISPGFLKDAISKMDSCEICEEQLIFRGENWVHIVAVS